MRRTFPLVTTQQYLIEREKWLREIKRGENVSVIFFPKTDRFRRLHQLLEDREFLTSYLGGKIKYLFQMTDFNVSLVEDRFDIHEHISRQLNMSNLSATPQKFEQWLTYFQKNNIRLVLILPDAEKYLTPENKHILSVLLEVVIDYAPTVTVMSFYETDITHPSHLSMLSVLKDLFENVFSYPLYSDEDTLGFTRYLQKKWETTIKPSEENKIVTDCGGHFWVVKEAVRELINSGGWSAEQEGLRFRLETIYTSMLPSEQKVTEKVVTTKKHFSPEETHSLAYLRKLNFLSDINHLKMGLFEKFLKKRTYFVTDFSLDEGHIMLNHILLDKFFSRKEYRVLTTLLKHKNTIVNRDKIAAVIWPVKTEDHYSDWAIDQIIARIRKRLVELSLNPSLIQVVRGKGYQLSLP